MFSAATSVATSFYKASPSIQKRKGESGESRKHSEKRKEVGLRRRNSRKEKENEKFPLCFPLLSYVATDERTEDGLL